MRMVKTVVLCAVVMAALAACSTGREGVNNRLGTITTTLAASPQDVTAAAADTLADMDLTVITNQATAIDGRVVARTAQDDSVEIDVDRVSEGVTELGIRVGLFGNEAMSLTILEGIRKRLE